MKSLKSLKKLFWEYDWNSVKKNLKSTYVIFRVLEFGNFEQFKILQKKNRT